MRVPIKLAALSLLIATQLSAQVSGLNDLVGARAPGAEQEMLRRGYVNTGGSQGDDRTYSNWWNASRRLCVTVATMEGRFASITPTSAPDCRQNEISQGGSDRPRLRPHSPSTGVVHQADLPRFCKGEAAAAFDRRPSEITTNLPIRSRSEIIVRGWFEERRTHFFTCRFSADGRFLSVR